MDCAIATDRIHFGLVLICGISGILRTGLTFDAYDMLYMSNVWFDCQSSTLLTEPTLDLQTKLWECQNGVSQMRLG